MADVLASHPADITRLVAEQKSLLDRWIRQRVSEESDLDPGKLRHSLGGYIEWTAHVVQAVAVGLKARRWTGTLAIVETMARDGIAKSTATPRLVGGTPSLLSQAFFQNAFALRLNFDNAPIVDGDIKKPLQTGWVLLGEARGNELAKAAQARMVEVLATYLEDVNRTGGPTVQYPAQPVPPSVRSRPDPGTSHRPRPDLPAVGSTKSSTLPAATRCDPSCT